MIWKRHIIVPLNVNNQDSVSLEKSGPKRRNRRCLVEVLPSAACLVCWQRGPYHSLSSERRLADKPSSLAVTLALPEPEKATSLERELQSSLHALILRLLHKTPFHIQNPEDGVVLISPGKGHHCPIFRHFHKACSGNSFSSFCLIPLLNPIRQHIVPLHYIFSIPCRSLSFLSFTYFFNVTVFTPM